MKKITLLFIGLAFICLTPLFAQPEHVYLIGGPVNKHDPNWLLDQKIELEKDEVNPSIFYYKGYLAYNWRGDERGNIKFLIADSWDGAYHPDSDENQMLSGTSPMSNDSRDTKWFIPEDRSGDGYYELTLNTDLMTLTVDLFRHDLNPEKIYIVGGSMPSGWDNINPEVMVRTNPEVAVYTWSGVMSSGDFKFLHPLSIGNWDFAYCATSNNEDVNFGVAQNVVFEVRNSEETPFDDYKFIMHETAECTIVVDLVNKTMTVTKDGEPYAQDIWITGSAIPGGKVKLESDNVDPLISYHYYGELMSGEFKFTTTEDIDVTTQFYVPSTSVDAISDDINISLTSDELAPGWTVSQADDLYKIKINILSNKYKGSIFDVDQVFIVGGATAVGWDAGNAIELTRGTGSESNIFTFDGNLIIASDQTDGNKFKFLLQKDWNPLSFHPQFEDESITDAQYYTEKHSVDYKWTVDEDKQGHYIIRLDVLEETIQADYSPVTSTKFINQDIRTDIFGSKDKIIINCKSQVVKSVEVFNLSGFRVANKLHIKNAEIALPKGIYIVKVNYDNYKTFVQKVSVQ